MPVRRKMTTPYFTNYCKWSSTTAGTASFTVGAAASADEGGAHDIPANCGVVDGAVYRYFARTADLSQTELGRGTYRSSTGKLDRTTILANSDGTTTAVNFATDPIIDLFPSPAQTVNPLGPTSTFPSGTLMLFQQSSAPAGWTKQTTHNDKALRVVSGAASSGGSNSFSSVLVGTITVDNTTLTISTMPSHDHTVGDVVAACCGFVAGLGFVSSGSFPANFASSFVGGGNPHDHTATLGVQYVDIIIAQKN